jgi:hypothetical protein
MKKMITIEQAKNLSTERLLKYYRSISRWVPSYDQYLRECPCKECKKVFQKIDEREEHRRQIKAILDARENVK